MGCAADHDESVCRRRRRAGGGRCGGPALGAAAPGLAGDARFGGAHYYEKAEEMLEREALDGVFIGTRCNLHVKYAEMVLARGCRCFLEKPVCIDEEQHRRLALASQGRRGRVTVSFPLRLSCIVQEMKRLADSGELGDIVTVQAVNNVPYGSVYYHSWYRDPSLTGGLFCRRPPMISTISPIFWASSRYR